MKFSLSKSLIILIFGYAFLYLPLGVVVFYSFNDSRVFSVWKGFSFKWYLKLFDNPEILSAVLSSLKIASMSATLATLLGTLTAIITVRMRSRHIPGRKMLDCLVASPLVMPDVMTGLALLLVFVAVQHILGWPAQRGLWSVTIAHVTLGMAYVYLVVQARLKDFDKSLEEAALDLGARTFRMFTTITVPLITPSLLAGWLLSFAISLDDVVLASFLSGPGATTLPMLIFSNIRLGISPEINALATVIIFVISVILTITGALVYHKQRSQ
jgi:putrescine transport system permease protein